MAFLFYAVKFQECIQTYFTPVGEETLASTTPTLGRRVGLWLPEMNVLRLREINQGKRSWTKRLSDKCVSDRLGTITETWFWKTQNKDQMVIITNSENIRKENTVMMPLGRSFILLLFWHQKSIQCNPQMLRERRNTLYFSQRIWYNVRFKIWNSWKELPLWRR